MAATPARSSRPACVAPRAGSRWRSSNDRTWPKASPSCPSDGLSSGPSHGSTAAVVWPRIGNASTATRSRFCAGPPFASWSEGFVKPQHDPGQTLRFLRDRSELPTLEDIEDVNFTGGIRSEEYLEMMRNGEIN